MDKAEFKKFSEKEIAKVNAFLAEVEEPDWDVENPVFFALHELEGEEDPQIVGVDAEMMSLLANIQGEHPFTLFKLILTATPVDEPYVIGTRPDGTTYETKNLGIVGAMMLVGVWQKNTQGERIGESITLLIEDKDYNRSYAMWKLERIEGQPPKFTQEPTKWFDKDNYFDMGGRMVNLFDLPDLEEHKELN